MQINIVSFMETICVNTSIRVDFFAEEKVIKSLIDFAITKAIKRTLEQFKKFDYEFSDLPFPGIKILVPENKILTNISRDEAISILQEILKGNSICFVDIL